MPKYFKYRNMWLKLDTFHQPTNLIEQYINFKGGKFFTNEATVSPEGAIDLINETNFLQYAFFFTWLHWVENLLLIKQGNLETLYHRFKVYSDNCILCKLCYVQEIGYGDYHCHFEHNNHICPLRCQYEPISLRRQLKIWYEGYFMPCYESLDDITRKNMKKNITMLKIYTVKLIKKIEQEAQAFF